MLNIGDPDNRVKVYKMVGSYKEYEMVNEW